MRRIACWLPILLLGFLLGIYDGKVALWIDGFSKPYYVSEYSAQVLPPADQQRLAEGIKIRDREELNRLLEDYLS